MKFTKHQEVAVMMNWFARLSEPVSVVVVVVICGFFGWLFQAFGINIMMAVAVPFILYVIAYHPSHTELQARVMKGIVLAMGSSIAVFAATVVSKQLIDDRATTRLEEKLFILASIAFVAMVVAMTSLARTLWIIRHQEPSPE